MKLRILADDLTGALDAAAPLTGLTKLGRVPVHLDSPSASDADVQALAIATRDVDSDALPELLAQAVPWLADADISFKKVDSLLRGNTLAEVAHIAQAGHFEWVIFAPAFPAQNRLTRADRHRVPDEAAGRVVAGGSLSSMFELLGLSARPVHWIYPGELPAEQVLIPDIATDGDLRMLVALADSGAARRWLWCGSAGMAHAWARQLGAREPAAAARADAAAPRLCLSASIHPVVRAQLTALREQGACEVMAADAAGLQRAALALQSRACVVLDLASPQVLAPAQAGAALATAMQSVVNQLTHPAQVVVIGGDTLLALCRAAGVMQLEALPERRSGWGRCQLIGGRWDGLICRTRSGAFGAPDDLCSVLNGASRSIKEPT